MQIKKWFPEVKNATPNAEFIFIGNKIDLRDENQCGTNGK